MSAVIMQRPGTRYDLEATPLRNVCVSHSAEFVVDSAREVMVPRTPIQYEGDEVIFCPEHMETEEMYPFVFLGHHLWVVKHSDESIEVYYAP